MQCFFYDYNAPSTKKRCRVLTECKCSGCKFFKTQQDFYKSEMEAKKRLDELGLEPAMNYDLQGKTIITTVKKGSVM